MTSKSKTQENFFKVRTFKSTKREKSKAHSIKSLKHLNGVPKKSKLMLPFALVMDQRKKHQRRRMVKTSHIQKRKIIENIYFKDNSININKSQ